MRIVGTQNRTEFELVPVKAMQRAFAPSRLLPSLLPPIPRGVYRGTHAFFNHMDDERCVQAARKLNRP